MAITLSMKGFEPFYSIISSLSPIETSNSSIEPGKRVVLPNMMLVLFIYTKYFVSVSSVESRSVSAFGSSDRDELGEFYIFNSSMSFYMLGSCFSTSVA